MSFTVITPKEEHFQDYYLLRWEVLRKPWNQPLGSERDTNEKESWHFAVVDEDGLIRGVCRLQNNKEGIGQIRYMAVDSRFQGKGLGGMLLQVAEDKAVTLGFTTIILQARENAVPFYQSKGYQIEDKTFILFDSIQHYLMKKDLK